MAVLADDRSGKFLALKSIGRCLFKNNDELSPLISIPVKAWDISKIAFRTFVPESEESRAKGAGGGDAND